VTFKAMFKVILTFNWKLASIWLLFFIAVTVRGLGSATKAKGLVLIPILLLFASNVIKLKFAISVSAGFIMEIVIITIPTPEK